MSGEGSWWSSASAQYYTTTTPPPLSADYFRQIFHVLVTSLFVNLPTNFWETYRASQQQVEIFILHLPGWVVYAWELYLTSARFAGLRTFLEVVLPLCFSHAVVAGVLLYAYVSLRAAYGGGSGGGRGGQEGEEDEETTWRKKLKVSFSPSLGDFPEKFSLMHMCRKVKWECFPDLAHLLGPEPTTLKASLSLNPGCYRLPLSGRSSSSNSFQDRTTGRTCAAAAAFEVRVAPHGKKQSLDLDLRIDQTELQHVKIHLRGVYVRNIGAILADLRAILKVRRPRHPLEVEPRKKNDAPGGGENKGGGGHEHDAHRHYFATGTTRHSRMHLLRRIGRYILWRVVFLLLWLLELLFRVNLTKVELADANCCWLLPTSYLCGRRNNKVEKPQAAFFSGYLEFHLLPSFLKIPFFAVQLPAAIVPQLGSAHLKEFVRRREVEDLLLSTSVRNGKGEKRKRNTSSLINRIDLSKVPVKTVLTQAFEMAKNWDVKLDCSVFYPETCDIYSFLPDSSTLHVSCSSSAQRGSDGSASSPGARSKVKLHASGGLVTAAASTHLEEVDGKINKMPKGDGDDEAIVFRVHQLEVDGQALLDDEGGGTSSSSCLLSIRHPLKPVRECLAEVLSWSTELGNEDFDVDEAEGFLSTSGSAAQIKINPSASNNSTTTTNNKVTQYLFDTLDQHEAEENVEIDEQNADIVRAYVGRRLKKKQQLLKERTRMIGLMKRLEISCDLKVDRPFCLDLLGRSGPSSSSSSSSRNLLDFTYYREGMVGKMAGGLKVSQFTIQSMRYKTESLWKFGSKSRNFLRIPQELNCEFRLKRLMICDIFLDDGTSEIQIATEPADVKIKGRCSCSPGGSGEPVVGTPGTINGDPPAPKNAVVWEIGLDKLDRGSRLRPTGKMQDENLLGFELLGVTRIAEDAEIPEFDFNLGEAIRTHLSGSWNLNFLASLSGGGGVVVGETGPPVPEIDADPTATTSSSGLRYRGAAANGTGGSGSGVALAASTASSSTVSSSASLSSAGSVTASTDGDRDLINLATMNGTTVEVILSQCGASLGGRLLYLDGAGTTAVHDVENAFRKRKREFEDQFYNAVGSTTTSGSSSSSATSPPPNNRTRVFIEVLDAVLGDLHRNGSLLDDVGTTPTDHDDKNRTDVENLTFNNINPILFRMGWNLRKTLGSGTGGGQGGGQQTAEDFSEMVLFGDDGGNVDPLRAFGDVLPPLLSGGAAATEERKEVGLSGDGAQSDDIRLPLPSQPSSAISGATASARDEDKNHDGDQVAAYDKNLNHASDEAISRDNLIRRLRRQRNNPDYIDVLSDVFFAGYVGDRSEAGENTTRAYGSSVRAGVDGLFSDEESDSGETDKSWASTEEGGGVLELCAASPVADAVRPQPGPSTSKAGEKPGAGSSAHKKALRASDNILVTGQRRSRSQKQQQVKVSSASSPLEPPSSGVSSGTIGSTSSKGPTTSSTSALRLPTSRRGGLILYSEESQMGVNLLPTFFAKGELIGHLSSVGKLSVKKFLPWEFDRSADCSWGHTPPAVVESRTSTAEPIPLSFPPNMLSDRSSVLPGRSTGGDQDNDLPEQPVRKSTAAIIRSLASFYEDGLRHSKNLRASNAEQYVGGGGGRSGAATAEEEDETNEAAESEKLDSLDRCVSLGGGVLGQHQLTGEAEAEPEPLVAGDGGSSWWRPTADAAAARATAEQADTSNGTGTGSDKPPSATPSPESVLSDVHALAWSSPLKFLYLSEFQKKRITALCKAVSKQQMENKNPHIQFQKSVKENKLELPWHVVSHWLQNDGIIAGVFTILGILGSPRLFNWGRDAFDELQRVVGILDRLNIQKASDLIPVDKLIEFLYLVLNIQEEDLNNLLNQQSSSHVVPRPAVNGSDGPKQVRASGSGNLGGQLQHHQAQGRAGGAGTALLDDQAADNQPYWKSQLTRFIRKLIRGEGVDITIAKNILSKAYPQWYDHWMVEIDRSLRIVNKIAIPMPMPPIAVSDSKSTGSTSPLHLQRLVPTAKELYNLCSSSSPPGVEAQATTARRASGALLAPYMNRTQLAYLLKHGCFEGADEKIDRRRLSYILHLKQTLAQIVDDIGGNSLLPQTHGIAFLLGDTLARSQSSGSQLHQQHRSQFGTSLLGPSDMAGLLRAILSNMNMTHFAQRALRLLLDILSTQPKIYVRGVFYELSLNGSQRVLSGLLMRLLDAPQTCFSVSNQIDRTQKLREILGLEEGLEGGGGSSTFHLPLPRRADYLAGGKLQRRSYYEAIYRIAATLIDESDEYLQLKQRLTVCSGEDERTCSTSSKIHIQGEEAVAVEQVEEKNYRDAEFESLVAHTRQAIAAADAAGSAWLEAVVGADAADAGGGKQQPLESFASCKLRKAAIAKYADAFNCCRRVVNKSNKKALFRCSWLKDFYERNYESLVIFYTAKNIMEDTDAVASWLVNQPWEVVCGGKRASGPRSGQLTGQHHGKKIGASPAAFASTNASLKSGTASSSAPASATAPPQQSEVAALVRRLQRTKSSSASGCQDQLDHVNLVRLIIAATYFYTEDHEATLTDPLNYLLFDFENDSTERTEVQRPQGHPHHLDLSHFTLLTAMGVITEGEKGREMENSFKRLTRKHGVKVVRSHTGTARHLEYNAGQIQKALKQALSEQPTNYWGWLGYSQGCANCWKAETELNTGTPDQQKLLQKLVCRNSLFSAANGTPQVTVLEWRISECGADLEMLLKSIQLHVSQNLNSFLLSALSFLLSSREFVFAIGGLHSLNHLGTIRGLWRGARMKENVPSLAVRAVGDGETLPECLVFISNILWTEAMHVPQDKLKKGGGVQTGGGGGGGSGASSEVQKSCSSSLAGVDGGGGLLLGRRADFDASVPAASEGNEKKNPNPPQPTSASRSRAGSGSSNVSPFRSGPIGSPIGSSPGSRLVPRIGLGGPPSFVQVKPFGSFPSLGSTSPRGVGVGTPGVAASQMPGPPLPPKQKPGQLANSSSPPAADEHCYNRKNPIAALCNIPQELKAGSNHDSQVTAFEAEPYPVYMSTEKAPNISAGPDLDRPKPNALMLKQHRMCNKLQRGHHWTPLTDNEVGFMTTDSDRKRGVYDGSRDKLVFPYVMVNARFGVIPSRGDIDLGDDVGAELDDDKGGEK